MCIQTKYPELTMDVMSIISENYGYGKDKFIIKFSARKRLCDYLNKNFTVKYMSSYSYDISHLLHRKLISVNSEKSKVVLTFESSDILTLCGVYTYMDDLPLNRQVDDIEFVIFSDRSMQCTVKIDDSTYQIVYGPNCFNSIMYNDTRYDILNYLQTELKSSIRRIVTDSNSKFELTEKISSTCPTHILFEHQYYVINDWGEEVSVIAIDKLPLNTRFRLNGKVIKFLNKCEIRYEFYKKYEYTELILGKSCSEPFGKYLPLRIDTGTESIKNISESYDKYTLHHSEPMILEEDKNA